MGNGRGEAGRPAVPRAGRHPVPEICHRVGAVPRHHHRHGHRRVHHPLATAPVRLGVPGSGHERGGPVGGARAQRPVSDAAHLRARHARRRGPHPRLDECPMDHQASTGWPPPHKPPTPSGHATTITAAAGKVRTPGISATASPPTGALPPRVGWGWGGSTPMVFVPLAPTRHPGPPRVPTSRTTSHNVNVKSTGASRPAQAWEPP